MKSIQKIYKTEFEKEFIDLSKIIVIEKCILCDNPKINHVGNEANIGFRVIVENLEYPILMTRPISDCEFSSDKEGNLGIIFENGYIMEITKWKVPKYGDIWNTLYASNIEKARTKLINAWMEFNNE